LVEGKRSQILLGRRRAIVPIATGVKDGSFCDKRFGIDAPEATVGAFGLEKDACKRNQGSMVSSRV